ncbi:hypothetical protein GCM10023205_58400 [Yinghuangia aomiensis]|uniref:DUF305 domain-containing protein n=1 Tax=Yinghuangia aomiensis TaxID=676205 RepID=A0ABP9HY84_9ACTN
MSLSRARGWFAACALFVSGAGVALTALAFGGAGAAPTATAPTAAAPSAASDAPAGRAPAAPAPSAGGPAAASPKPPNAADLTFALAMVPHHAQAVEMSRILLAKQGTQHLVTALAERIRTDQDREVADMNSWLTAWDQDPVPVDAKSVADHTAHHGGTGGMLTTAQLAALEAADGPTASRMFLDLMIEHHLGAVAMARTEAADGANVFTRNLARHIVAEQQSEIVQMRTLYDYV